jgi:hypothetical protein
MNLECPHLDEGLSLTHQVWDESDISNPSINPGIPKQAHVNTSWVPLSGHTWPQLSKELGP